MLTLNWSFKLFGFRTQSSDEALLYSESGVVPLGVVMSKKGTRTVDISSTVSHKISGIHGEYSSFQASITVTEREIPVGPNVKDLYAVYHMMYEEAKQILETEMNKSLEEFGQKPKFLHTLDFSSVDNEDPDDILEDLFGEDD